VIAPSRAATESAIVDQREIKMTSLTQGCAWQWRVWRGAWKIALLCGTIQIATANQSAANPGNPNVSPGSARALIDIKRAIPLERKRNIALDDLVSVRTIGETTLSPDGKTVGFLISQKFIECNCTQTAIYIAGTEEPYVVRRLTQGLVISNLQWSPDGVYLTYLSAQSGARQLWRVNVESGRTSPFVEHDVTRERSAYTDLVYGDEPLAIVDYRWSPDGRAVAFTVLPSGESGPSVDAGFLYDDQHMRVQSLLSRDWVAAAHRVQLWIYDVSSSVKTKVWESGQVWSADIGSMAWSHDAKKLAFSHTDQDLPEKSDVVVLDVRTGNAFEARHAVDYVRGIGWSDDDQALAVIERSGAMFYGALRFASVDPAPIRAHLEQAEIVKLFAGQSTVSWQGDDVYFESKGAGARESSPGLYTYSLKAHHLRRLTLQNEKISACSSPIDGLVSCVSQSPTVPPQVTLITLKDGLERKLFDPNPEFENIALAQVRELKFKNKYGDITNGYLVSPLNVPSRQRVPLVVIGYGADGDFVTAAADALNSYPAQVFARDGIAVLILNPPIWGEWEGRHFSRGRRAWGEAPFATLTAAMKQVELLQPIDTARIGFMGHSWAGAWVEFSASHSTMFKALELHNGGTSDDIVGYGVSGNQQRRDFQAHFMGGSPFSSKYFRNYEEFAPEMTAEHISAPVLMEYDFLESIFGLGYYTALRDAGVPVDLFIYPDDGHVFYKPAHILASLRRDLDWFEFWLLEKENAGADAEVQYARWRQYRSNLGELKSRNKPLNPL